MTKQEEIRVGVERILDELLFSPGESDDGRTYNLTGCITNLFEYLHSKDVVRKVEGGLPECVVAVKESKDFKKGFDMGQSHYKLQMHKGGYEATESLIEVKK